MTQEEYKQKLAVFQNSCRAYPIEKQRLEELESQYPALKEMEFEEDHFKIDLSDDFGSGMMELYQFLKENVQAVEETMQNLLSRCGVQAYDVVHALYMDGKTQTEVGEDYGLSRRQIQYSLDKWMKAVFEEEETENG